MKMEKKIKAAHESFLDPSPSTRTLLMEGNTHDSRADTSLRPTAHGPRTSALDLLKKIRVPDPSC